MRDDLKEPKGGWCQDDRCDRDDLHEAHEIARRPVGRPRGPNYKPPRVRRPVAPEMQRLRISTPFTPAMKRELERKIAAGRAHKTGKKP